MWVKNECEKREKKSNYGKDGKTNGMFVKLLTKKEKIACLGTFERKADRSNEEEI